MQDSRKERSFLSPCSEVKIPRNTDKNRARTGSTLRRIARGRPGRGIGERGSILRGTVASDANSQFHLLPYGTAAQQVTQDYALEVSFLRIITTQAIPRLSNNQEDGLPATQDPGDLFERSRLGLRNKIRPVSARPRRANVCGSGTATGHAPSQTVMRSVSSEAKS